MFYLNHTCILAVFCAGLCNSSLCIYDFSEEKCLSFEIYRLTAGHEPEERKLSHK